MEKAPVTRPSYARLNFEDGEVVVTPRDRSIFMINAEKAIEACRNAMLREEGIERFESEVLVPLHDWCVAHADRVDACYIPKPGPQVSVFIVTSNPQFDFDLAEEMAALERRLARSGWRVGLTQLPRMDRKTQATFFHFEGALEVYAQRGSTPQKCGKQAQISRRFFARPMRKQPVVYFLVILPILWVGGMSLIIGLLFAYAEITGTPQSSVSNLNGLLITLPAFFLWVPVSLLLSNLVLRQVPPLRRIAERYVSETNSPGFAESQLQLLKMLLVFALLFVPLIVLGFVL